MCGRIRHYPAEQRAPEDSDLGRMHVDVNVNVNASTQTHTV